MKKGVDYDSTVVKACPNYNKGLAKTASLVLPATEGIISLGTGTGNLEGAIFTQLPKVKITGYEWDLDHLNIARKKLGRKFVGFNTDITKLEIPVCDCVVSSLTLHHTPNDSKEDIFRRGYASLRSGGRFINYDIITARNRTEHREFLDYCLGFMRQNGLPDDFIEAERDIINGVGEGADITMTLQRQKGILERLGFKFTLDWKDHLFVVYHCDRM